MNLVDIEVIEILSPPEQNTWGWTVKVNQDSWGHVFQGSIYFKTREEAEKLKVGYVYQG